MEMLTLSTFNLVHRKSPCWDTFTHLARIFNMGNVNVKGYKVRLNREVHGIAFLCKCVPRRRSSLMIFSVTVSRVVCSSWYENT